MKIDTKKADEGIMCSLNCPHVCIAKFNGPKNSGYLWTKHTVNLQDRIDKIQKSKKGMASFISCFLLRANEHARKITKHLVPNYWGLCYGRLQKIY